MHARYKQQIAPSSPLLLQCTLCLSEMLLQHIGERSNVVYERGVPMDDDSFGQFFFKSRKCKSSSKKDENVTKKVGDNRNGEEEHAERTELFPTTITMAD
jgi:hypothetical protein